MKKIISIGLLILLGIGALPRLIHAQRIEPEFELRLRFTYDGQLMNTDTVGFGYDPNAVQATDTSLGYNANFGEMYYPNEFASGDYFLGFQIDNEGDYSEIDILPKPAVDTFLLEYEIIASSTEYPATLSWNSSNIPSAIKAILVTPESAPNDVLVNMVAQSSVTLTSTATDLNYYGNWEPAMITIYYNWPTPASDVAPTTVATSGLLSLLKTYPNPMPASGASNGTLLYTLSEPASVLISAYDIAGREVMHFEQSEPAGAIVTDLAGLQQAHGALLISVTATSATQTSTEHTMIVRE